MDDLKSLYINQRVETRMYLDQLLDQISPEAQVAFWEYVSRKDTMFELKLRMIQLME